MNIERVNKIRSKLGLPLFSDDGKLPVGLGDKIAAVATPIARMLGSDCIDPVTTQLKSDSGCGKMKQRLNEGMSVKEAMKLRLKGE